MFSCKEIRCVRVSKFYWGIRVGLTSSLVINPRCLHNPAASPPICEQTTAGVHSSVLLLLRPFSFPSVQRCRDPIARWCITKDTCSVDVAWQIDCVLVSACVFACIYSFISFWAETGNRPHPNCFEVNISISASNYA